MMNFTGKTNQVYPKIFSINGIFMSTYLNVIYYFKNINRINNDELKNSSHDLQARLP